MRLARLSLLCALLVLAIVGTFWAVTSIGRSGSKINKMKSFRAKNNAIDVEKELARHQATALVAGGGESNMFTDRETLRALFVSRLISSQTIFVNVAAFRDILCVESVREIFSAAKHPERINIGIIDQRIPGDRVCVPPEYLRYLPARSTQTTTNAPDQDPEYPSTPRRFVSCYKKNFCPSDNIRIRYVDWTEARGPTYGRFVAGLMYQGESFYMMIDSHSRFDTHFDEFMILDVLRMRATYDGLTTPNAKGGVLSYYPSGFNRFDVPVNSNADIMAMCKTEYVKELSVLRNGARWMKQPKRPMLQPYTAAGFLFSDATAQLDVPFDPYLDYVFDGEEILFTVRLFTAGYDAYLPGRAYIFHHYDRHKAPRFWSVPRTQWPRIQGITRKRVHYFLETYENQTTKLIVDKGAASRMGLDIHEDIYGLGKARPLDSFYQLAGVDRKTWKVDQDAYCSMMERKGPEFAKKYPLLS